MSKLSLAVKLADETGIALLKAKQYVDDVGLDVARKTADDVAQAGSRTIADWWKPALATGGLVGGGALLWRQQDIEEAQAIASQQQDYTEAWTSLMESGLSPAAKKELAIQLLDESPAGEGGGNKKDDQSNDGLIPDDPAMLIVLVIVLVMVLRYSLGGDS